jgi:hypothetical protein
LAGCASPASSLASLLPASDAIPGWSRVEETGHYGRENLYDLVDGQAESYFAYGFEQAAVQRYRSASGGLLQVELWKVSTPADAYGLFTLNRSGAPVEIGTEGDMDPGSRLAFWQANTYVRIGAVQAVSDDGLWAFGRALATALPTGGDRPGLMNRLVRDGLLERSAIFFHEGISIQNELWLGVENKLGLSHATDGVVARYELNGSAARLLLIQYPDAAKASAGLSALQTGVADDLVSAKVRGVFLGAVFGKVDAETAGRLTDQALAGN